MNPDAFLDDLRRRGISFDEGPTASLPPIITDEESFLQAVIALAKRNGWLVYHTRHSLRSEPGFPDLVCVRHWRVVFAELKSDKGNVSPEQALWVGRLAQTSAEIYVWRPDDWERIVEILT